MPRPRRFRRIGFLPNARYFKPAGIPLQQISEVILPFEGLEALRLRYVKKLTQDEAAKEMGVSQPTFHRILFDACSLIADALINNKAIRIEGGTYIEINKPKGRRIEVE